ncbi:argininosuccinate lyase [Candidatus Roizmanbacteria bacterium]|nr:argininosuccinate lyase [Candidatus Roizmanbacteria bacterium]
MVHKLWEKKGEKLLKDVELFETGSDIELDGKFAQDDIMGSIAHGYMLSKIGILSSEEFKDAQKGLLEILKLIETGKEKLEFGDEDIHTKVENLLTERAGQVGKKIHTGRSRNDQVLVDMRLYAKRKLLNIWGEHLDLIDELLLNAQKYTSAPMPGYTHMQKAMPSSAGMWFGSFAESLMDSLVTLKAAYELNDQCPLGSAAAYGTTLPLDRELTARLLGFKKVQSNALYSQNSRGKIESVILFALVQQLFDISKLATDVLLFTTSEFQFFKVDDCLCTGSSIMPQKKNVDLAELLRSKVHVMESYLSQVFNGTANLPSGYNRDFQDTKKPFIEGLELAEQSLRVSYLLVHHLTPNEAALKKAMTPELYATAAAYDLVQKGVPFREAYQQIGLHLDELQKCDADEMLKKSTHLGGTGNLLIDKRLQELEKERAQYVAEHRRFTNAMNALETLTY